MTDGQKMIFAATFVAVYRERLAVAADDRAAVLSAVVAVQEATDAACAIENVAGEMGHEFHEKVIREMLS